MFAEIGAQLKEARESLGITLDEMHERTRIQRSFLQAIENGRFHKLPSPFYVRTYIRSYANCIRLEPQHILRKYRKAEQAQRINVVEYGSKEQNTINPSHTGEVILTELKVRNRRIAVNTALTIAKPRAHMSQERLQRYRALYNITKEESSQGRLRSSAKVRKRSGESFYKSSYKTTAAATQETTKKQRGILESTWFFWTCISIMISATAALLWIFFR